MNQLHPSEQEIVNKESKKKFHAYDYLDHRTTYKGGFQEGVEFALQELVKGRMIKFAEWIRTFEALERQNGQWVIESQLSDEQIVKAFIADSNQEHLKQQEDEQAKAK